MYCPVCGTESADGIRFCKQCGSGLTAPLSVEYVRPVRITGAVWAVAVMTFLCFGALFGCVMGLAGMGIRSEDVLAPIGVLGSFSIVGICALMVRLVSRAAGISGPVTKQKAPVQQAIRAPYNQTQLPPPQSYVPSVTENTTRSFDRAPGESSSR
jgi:hypothetical protein